MAWRLDLLINKIPGRVDVSVVLPAHNEADRIESAVKTISQALSAYGCSFEIIIAEDGSIDGTDKKAKMLAQNFSFVRHFHSDTRLGRGKALKNMFKKSSGETLVYMDVDLATNIKHLEGLLNSVRNEGYAVTTGSRLLPESNVKRSRTRNIASKTYNFMVQKILKSKVMDHQCGFKAFQRESLLQLLDEVDANHWFWDTEVLVRSQLKGLRIKEIPVDWTSGKETKVRLIRDSFDMGFQVLVLWWHLKKEN